MKYTLITSLWDSISTWQIATDIEPLTGINKNRNKGKSKCYCLFTRWWMLLNQAFEIMTLLKNYRNYLSELIGTFALVFCGTGAIIVNQATGGTITHVGIAMTFGLIVSAMIFALGDISGAHLNPAVTLVLAIDKRIDKKEILPYIVSQAIGGILASLLLRTLFPKNEYLGTTLPSGSPMQSFILETVLTFILVLVIFNVSTGAKEKGITAAIAIGGTVALQAVFAGPISGASMNPIRSIAPALVSQHIEHLWIYIMAPISGAVLAVFIHQVLHPKEK